MTPAPAVASAPSRARRLAEARDRTAQLFSCFRPEAIYERPVPERHRLIFYLGHLEAFDWNLLGRQMLGLSAFHPGFDRLFAFGIDPPPGELPGEPASAWPAPGPVLAYCETVRSLLDPELGRVPADAFEAALEHRWMHAETLAYLIHNLSPAFQLRPGGLTYPTRWRSPREEWIEVPAGTATLGQEPGAFGWCNEFARHEVRVPAFRAQRHKVTNGQYRRFVEAGHAAPHFWVRRGAEWMLRCMFDEILLPDDWPVYVTWREASAYAAWRGKRLLTEPEFHRAAYGTPGGGERPYPWGSEPPAGRPGNFDFARWDPVPVDATPESDSAFGFAQLVGNGWEWTSSVFAPFPGFQPLAFYPGYSADFFDGQHYVLKGGSPRTAACLLRRSFRNWFRPDYPYAYAGFRLAESL
jgi:formylglycine-generating enzyme required for sulfatase activity